MENIESSNNAQAQNFDKDGREIKFFKLNGESMSFETKTINRDGVELALFSGLLSTWKSMDNPDRVEDFIRPGAFAKTLRQLNAKGRFLRLLNGHDRKKLPIGGFPPNSLIEDAVGLRFKDAELNLGRKNTKGSQDANTVYDLLLAGHLSDTSIGFSIVDSKRHENGTRELIELALWEGSIVDEPANPEAVITEVKKISRKDIDHVVNERTLERFLRDSGVCSKEAAIKLASRFTAKRRDSVVVNKDYESPLSKNELNQLNNLIKQIKETCYE